MCVKGMYVSSRPEAAKKTGGKYVRCSMLIYTINYNIIYQVYIINMGGGAVRDV